ncbi:MAG: tRNA epoxyqueuosine(34) reductase QueG [Planctomycetes bacterium]|nr:tRNA epoxyqueuosine(34) reductase QueG [Planctomycetota bacterium]
MRRAEDTNAPYGATDDAAQRERLKVELKEAARALGLADLGVTGSEPLPRGDYFEQWLAQGRNAGMDWLEPGTRTRPTDLLPSARTVLVAALRYAKPQQEPAPIAAYALRDDYHLVLKQALRLLARRLLAFAPGSEVRIAVDSAPLREREAAQRAGVGWIGKNTMLVHLQHGCYTLLGTLLWSEALPPDPPAVDHCADCRRCLDACPTAAFPAPYQLDASRCLSYWTIEQQGPLPEELREPLATRAFGCDACLAACPFGGRALHAESPLLPTLERHAALSLRELLVEARDRFWKWFRHTPVSRGRRRGLLRNLLVAAGNSGELALREVVAPFCQDEDPLLADHARAALARLDALARDKEPP